VVSELKSPPSILKTNEAQLVFLTISWQNYTRFGLKKNARWHNNFQPAIGEKPPNQSNIILPIISSFRIVIMMWLPLAPKRKLFNSIPFNRVL
jgi:hypothetical protein